jgi:hypothetical protein
MRLLWWALIGLCLSAGVGPVRAQNLQIIGNGPGGRICMGPMGPGPCALVQQWIMTHPLPPPRGMLPAQPILPPTYQLPSVPGAAVAAGAPTFNPSARLAPGASPQDIAMACAQARGQDVAGFVECTGAKVILPSRDQQVLECAVSSTSTEDFANCSAPKVGINLTDNQRILANCAMNASGDEDKFSACADTIMGSAITHPLAMSVDL